MAEVVRAHVHAGFRGLQRRADYLTAWQMSLCCQPDFEQKQTRSIAGLHACLRLANPLLDWMLSYGRALMIWITGATQQLRDIIARADGTNRPQTRLSFVIRGRTYEYIKPTFECHCLPAVSCIDSAALTWSAGLH